MQCGGGPGRERVPIGAGRGTGVQRSRAKVRTNTFVRDLDLAGVNVLDGRRREVVADGFTLWHGAQLAIDTTLVSPLHRHSTARRTAADRDGATLLQARRTTETTYPELSGEGGRARLVVHAAEVGGRWSEEAAQFLRALAKASARTAPLILQNRVKAAWLRRWSGVLACSAARAFAWSFLDKPANPGTGADAPPMHEVLRDDRFA